MGTATQPSQKKMKLEILNMAPQHLETNSVVISNDGLCAVFDPWGRADDWRKFLAANNLKLHKIFCTHGHYDHISAAPFLDAPWFLNKRDWDFIENQNQLLARLGLPEITDAHPIDIDEGRVEILPGIAATVLACPGHSRGGLSFHVPTVNVILVGDTLFQTSFGRTDFTGGNEKEIFNSIKKIYNTALPDDCLVVHGHGPATNIGWLKQHNKFFKGE